MSEILPIDKFPHNQIIKGSNIQVSDLDDDLRLLLTDFTKRYNGYKMKPKEDMFKVLMATSNIISQNLYDYYVDKQDQDVKITPEKELTPKEVKEVIEDIKETANEPADNSTAHTGAQSGNANDGNGGQTPPAPEPVEPAPNPIPEPEPEKFYNDNEKAMHLLFKEGKTEGITKAMLKEKGFDTSMFGPLSARGCKVGKYHLYKEPSESNYKLKQL